jgi:predicted signal transduction protein with EAL and GGDEF domain
MITQTIQDASRSDLLENLFARADQAMYIAKQAGKNCAAILDPDKVGEN